MFLYGFAAGVVASLAGILLVRIVKDVTRVLTRSDRPRRRHSIDTSERVLSPARLARILRS